MSDLPSNDELAEEFNWAVNYWRSRNSFIDKVRQMVEGNNPIALPKSVQYKAKLLRSYILTILINEKISRYMSIPTVQVVVDNPLDPECRERSSKIEKAMSTIQYEMERKGDGDVWSRVVTDAALLDTGIEKIERAPAAFWPELVESDRNGGIIYPFMSDARISYKKSHGSPFRALYSPLESVYPIYDGTTAIKVFEAESRSLYSCMKNPLFDKEPLSRFPQGKVKGIDVQIPIIHYCDDTNYGYYCLAPGSGHDYNAPFKIDTNNISINGSLFPLYSYKHNLGQVLYNFVGGRYGGWKTDKNRIEGLGKALLDFNQALDEIFSQMFTNIRAKYWSTLLWKIDPEQRGYSPTSPPPSPKIEEGETLTLLKGEDLVPLFQPQSDPTVMWFVDQIRQQVSQLGGGSVLFGHNEPGVDTGYHNAQQISQAEHLDNKLESNLAQGVNHRCTLVCLHAQQIDEPIWTKQVLREDKSTTKYLEYSILDPADLDPLPEFDAKVRQPKPIDFSAAIRLSREASTERGIKGALYSDDTIHDKFLSTEYPDIERKKRIIEDEQNKLLANNFISQQIMEKVVLRQTQGQPGSANMSNTDLALAQAINSTTGQSAQMGGIDPKILMQLNESNQMPMKTGVPVGDSEPEARVGEAIAGAQNVG